jgi:hypothetical protein
MLRALARPARRCHGSQGPPRLYGTARAGIAMRRRFG